MVALTVNGSRWRVSEKEVITAPCGKSEKPPGLGELPLAEYVGVGRVWGVFQAEKGYQQLCLVKELQITRCTLQPLK